MHLRKVKIDGQEYMQNTKNKKLYSMPRWGITRKVMRNIARNELKQKGYSKPNKCMKKSWKEVALSYIEREVF